MSALKCFFISCVVGLFILSLSTPCYSAEKWARCELCDVMVCSGSRIHIKCTNKPDGFSFFAVPLSDAEFANQVLSIATAAIIYKKTVNVLYNPSDNTTGSTFGCAPKDCRPLIAIGLTP